MIGQVSATSHSCTISSFVDQSLRKGQVPREEGTPGPLQQGDIRGLDTRSPAAGGWEGGWTPGPCRGGDLRGELVNLAKVSTRGWVAVSAAVFPLLVHLGVSASAENLRRSPPSFITPISHPLRPVCHRSLALPLSGPSLCPALSSGQRGCVPARPSPSLHLAVPEDRAGCFRARAEEPGLPALTSTTPREARSEGSGNVGQSFPHGPRAQSQEDAGRGLGEEGNKNNGRPWDSGRGFPDDALHHRRWPWASLPLLQAWVGFNPQGNHRPKGGWPAPSTPAPT